MDNSILLEGLKACKLFKSFSEEELNSLATSKEAFLKSYSSEDILFMEGEECNHLSVVAEGTIEIVKLDSEGNILIVSTLEKGNVFGENLLFGDMHFYPMSVVCKNSAKVFHIRKSYVATLLQRNYEFLLIFLKVLSNKAMALSSKLKQVSMKSLRQMICDYILDIYNKEKSLDICLNMSKKEWADKLGVQRPSLSRELMNMKKDGLIDYDRKNIKILDLEEIEFNK
ncbi:Crp/Fnr family transcriptional regulator [Clostridium sp. 'White wine YQ']|uniref:Crp/Fnr family transcriptional regulator n=1 Tax=Clostridium sp. 'White wine YQ' TaxID=3027474 RepID=UPI002366AC2D|nr:Crp/Fnr family transcriptional regulator [Clostridium sp. 'White wine YQ']MDD7795104.1 Crp/Fnr family transcriptional regulator [Clostridium sp. 'White wine YQ']